MARKVPVASLSLLALLSLHCSSQVADGAGGSGTTASHASTTSAATTSTGQGAGLPEPTTSCVSVVAGSDGGLGGGAFDLAQIGAGSDVSFTRYVDQQTLQMEWGFQGLQHFPFVPRVAYVKEPLVAFVELVPDQGQNGAFVQVFVPACASGWSEIQGLVLPLPNPADTVGTLKITAGTCPAAGCDPTKPQYGMSTVYGASEVKHVHVLAPVGPQPGSGGAGGFFGG